MTERTSHPVVVVSIFRPSPTVMEVFDDVEYVLHHHQEEDIYNRPSLVHERGREVPT